MANNKDSVLVVAKALHLQNSLTKEFPVAWYHESDTVRKLYLREADDLVTQLESANRCKKEFVILAKAFGSSTWEGVLGWKSERQENELAVILSSDEDMDALHRCDLKEATRIIHHLSKYGEYGEIKMVDV